MLQVLVVEDDPDYAEVLRLQLARSSVFVAAIRHSVSGALDVLPSVPVDAIILDLGLVGSTGLESLRILRAKTNLPCVVLTGHPSSFDADEIVRLDADFLDKPCDTRTLVRRLQLEIARHALTQYRELREAATCRA